MQLSRQRCDAAGHLPNDTHQVEHHVEIPRQSRAAANEATRLKRRPLQKVSRLRQPLLTFVFHMVYRLATVRC